MTGKDEEISLVHQRGGRVSAKLQHSEISQVNMEQSLQDYLENTRPSEGAVEFEAMKTALQSVHPFAPSVFGSEFYLITPETVRLGDQVFGFFAIKLKNFSKRVIRDFQQVYAMLYEVDCRIVHRQSQEVLRTVFPVFDLNVKPALQQMGLGNGALDSIEAHMHISGSSDDPSLIRSIFSLHFSHQSGLQDQELHLAACILEPNVAFSKVGIHDITLTLRNRPIARAELYVIPHFLTQPEQVLLVNSLRLSQYQIAQRFAVRRNAIECLSAPVTLQIAPITYLHKYGSYHTAQAENVGSAVAPPPPSPPVAESPEFSYEETPAVPQSPSKVQKTSIFSRLFRSTASKAQDQVNQFNIQSTRSRKQIQIQTLCQYRSSPFVLDYNYKALKNDEIAVVCLDVSQGEVCLFFDAEHEEAIVPSTMAQSYGVLVEEQWVRFQSKFNVYSVKFVLTDEHVDVYQGSEFLASYKYTGIYVKLLEKGAYCEIVGSRDL